MTERDVRLEEITVGGGRVIIAGADVSSVVTGGSFGFRVGQPPRLDLDIVAVDTSYVGAEGVCVRFLFNGEEFTRDDVRLAREAGLADLARRLASALGLEPNG